ncbi:MAG: BON domain-containing protein [Candidatus Korobacteraceae bacterium]
MMVRSRLSVSILLVLALGLSIACSRESTVSDSQIVEQVQAKLSGNSSLQGKQIQIQSSNGTVTLSGSVASDFERMAAANDAAQIQGVRTVVNNLQVAQESMAQAPEPAPMAEAQAPPAAARPSPAKRVPTPARQTEPQTSVREFNEASVPAPTATPAPAAPVVRTVRVPEGTALAVRLIDPLDTQTAQAGQTFRGSLSAPVVVDGETVIPANADVEGEVVEAKSAGRFAGQSLLTLELTRLTVNGRSYDVQSNTWTKQASSTGKKTATKVGIGTALGAIVGGIAGGGKGAAIGAAAGAGAGTGVQAASGGEEIKLPSETLLDFSLASALNVTPAATRTR